MATMTMATLVGTDAQIAFATDIRDRLVSSLVEERAMTIPEAYAEIATTIALLARQTSAAWLINVARGIPATDLLERIGSYQRRGPQSKLDGFVVE